MFFIEHLLGILDTIDSRDGAETDGNLVMGPAWPAHPAWLAQFLEVLGTRITL